MILKNIFKHVQPDFPAVFLCVNDLGYKLLIE